MSEFRQNFITKEWVIIATERARRPDQFVERRAERPPLPDHDPSCPFCPGNESLTGEETYRVEGASWSVRAVRNKFAPLDPRSQTQREYAGKFLSSGGFGIAEVIIESPLHNRTLAMMAPREAEAILRAMLARYQSLAAVPNISLITLFKNHGARAGTSLEHAHAQIIATPIIPPHVRDPFQKAMLHFDTFGICGYCEMLEEEIRQERRIVHANRSFVVSCPFASRTPFEVRIIPRRHAASFAWIAAEELEDFAEALSVTLRKLNGALDSPDYNFIIRSSPIGDEDVRYLHWYFLLIPKITTPAGFELGTGIYINTAYPEECAEYLRSM